MAASTSLVKSLSAFKTVPSDMAEVLALVVYGKLDDAMLQYCSTLSDDLRCEEGCNRGIMEETLVCWWRAGGVRRSRWKLQDAAAVEARRNYPLSELRCT